VAGPLRIWIPTDKAVWAGPAKAITSNVLVEVGEEEAEATVGADLVAADAVGAAVDAVGAEAGSADRRCA
jgi:hypothetical protein